MTEVELLCPEGVAGSDSVQKAAVGKELCNAASPPKKINRIAKKIVLTAIDEPGYLAAEKFMGGSFHFPNHVNIFQIDQKSQAIRFKFRFFKMEGLGFIEIPG
jgi:hypothetical protein